MFANAEKSQKLIRKQKHSSSNYLQNLRKQLEMKIQGWLIEFPFEIHWHFNADHELRKNIVQVPPEHRERLLHLPSFEIQAQID